jgi:hypothetical protein
MQKLGMTHSYDVRKRLLVTQSSGKEGHASVDFLVTPAANEKQKLVSKNYLL